MATFSVNTHHAFLNSVIVIKAEGHVTIEDTITGLKYKVLNKLETHLSAGRHILISDEHEEVIVIEDAIKLGGGRIKHAHVFDNNPWIFVTTSDRLYITNSETHEEKVEYNITPDEIECLPTYVYNTKSKEFFLFKTKNDYAIYNVETGKIIIQFSNHIFSNGHLVIYNREDFIEIYDFRKGETIARFEGQYSFGKNKFFFIRERQLHGLNLSTSYINKISYVGEVNDSDLLQGNYLLKLVGDCPNKKVYSYYSLGNGEYVKRMSVTKIESPFYILSWMGEKTHQFSQVEEDYSKFIEESRLIRLSHPNIHAMCIGLRINSRTTRRTEERGLIITLHGEIMSYPNTFILSFMAEGLEGEKIDLANYTVEIPKVVESSTAPEQTNSTYSLEDGEKEIGVSNSGNLLITYNKEGVFMCDLKKSEKHKILQDTFDKSNYSNAYFTSDGRNVLLRVNKSEAQLLGLDDMSSEQFEVDGFTLARNEGCNGYKPEVLLSNGRKPIWRDPITLKFIEEEDMSSHIFKSPDGKYIAELQMKTVFFNHLTNNEISMNKFNALRAKYNWTSETTEEDKKPIIELRKGLIERSDRYDLFGKIIDRNRRQYSKMEDEKKKEKRQNEQTDNDIERYIYKECDFVSLFIDKLGYVCYRENIDGAEEKRILIGRNVFFLNYVSFSYDSKHLSFAAKMKEDDFRSSQEGVFEIFDLKKEVVVKRIENYHNQQLWAVWMTMFSKTGDVAFYDSCANAYLLHKSDDFEKIEVAPGKSLLCFSPSGRYMACSDQNYIDYTHHPYGNWGHQPSGNVFIHEVNDFQNCIEHYNDLGDGVSGVATKSGNVASAAFSQDETKLLVVGNDGVVVVRNLKNTKVNNI